ncbi:integrase domain-containing protein [uncultured Pseudoteredinibacter sp.]|uniref:integrase domain-containing protein n=1 Tax=uncultured Pseudoteredinibacter sp. TaxID=1641701 RepID=UPI00261ADB5F|nr:integrase domain-containing protein [uncultured Pseudoteredinibacter sp.]
MPRKTVPLSSTQVKQAKVKEKEYNLVDGGGLALRIKPNGSKLWIFNYYRPITKKRANLGFGTYPEVSLADARRKREENRQLLAQGIDPKQHREEQQRQILEENSQTLQRVLERWFEVKKTSITAHYAEDIIRSLRNHILPKLGQWPLHKLTAPLVIDTLKPLANTGKLEAVKRVTQRLNEVMVYAVNTGIVHHNPLAGIRHAFETPKVTNNPTLKPEELPELMQALYKANIRLVTRYLIAWQLHTMTRPGEAAGARWDEIDSEQGVWLIPPERMKKRREHIIPLSPQALDLLKAMKPISGKGEYIFPSDIHPRKHANNSTANVALKRMGFKGRLTAHGMRALASTTLNEQGFDSDLVEAALAHVDKNAVRGAYNRAQYLKRRSVMMNWWSERIEQAAKGNLTHNGQKALKLVNGL